MTTAGNEPEHGCEEAPPVLRHDRRDEREDPDRREQQHPVYDLDQRLTGAVGQLDEGVALVFGEPRGGDREERHEHDHGQQVAVDGRLDGIRGNELDDEARAARDVFRGLLNERRVGLRGGAQGGLPFGRHDLVREHDRADEEADDDRHERGAPEERERADHEAAHAAQIPEPRDPANRAVATRGMTTIDSKFRNSVPMGRRCCAAVTSSGCPRLASAAATSPRRRPAPRAYPIHKWLLIDPGL